MYEIANVPAVRRALNFLGDRPWHHFRWRPVPEAKIDWGESEISKGLSIRGDPSQRSKADDPDWRRNWNWVVCDLEIDMFGDAESYLLVHTTTGFWRTMFSVQSRQVALRVGPDDMVLYHCVAPATPIIPCPFHCTLGLLTREEVQSRYFDASLH